MVNPSAFRGSRKEFLMGEKAAYSAGMAGGYGADALALIQRRYFKRYPVNLPHHEEPTAEHLAAVNDEAPEPEPEEPNPEVMTIEECEAATKELEKRQTILRFRKAVSCSCLLSMVIALNSERGPLFPANQTLDGIPVHERSRPEPQGVWGQQPLPCPSVPTNWKGDGTPLAQDHSQRLAQDPMFSDRGESQDSCGDLWSHEG